MAWLEREVDPSTPPWLTVRFYVALATIACSITALVLR
jgi:hypothetical protein